MISPLLLCLPVAYGLLQFLISYRYRVFTRLLSSPSRQLLLIVFCALWLGLIAGFVKGVADSI